MIVVAAIVAVTCVLLGFWQLRRLDDRRARNAAILERRSAEPIAIEDANGNSIKLESSGVTVNAAAKVTVTAGTAEISAGMLTVNAGMSRFSGVVQCDTMISNSVISASYSPGAGNIW